LFPFWRKRSLFEKKRERDQYHRRRESGKLFLCLSLSVLFFPRLPTMYLAVFFLSMDTYILSLLSFSLSFVLLIGLIACVSLCTHTTVFSHALLIPITRSDCTLATLGRSNTLECTHDWRWFDHILILSYIHPYTYSFKTHALYTSQNITENINWTMNEDDVNQQGKQKKKYHINALHMLRF
jgi:hypothetical protein